jgi:Na+-translocating ferredoxin:NAD+ oxidoreductase RnfG subunit
VTISSRKRTRTRNGRGSRSSTAYGYASTTDKEWKVKKDGGHFDSVAGATVTPRAVIKAVRKATKYVAENQTQLYASK